MRLDTRMDESERDLFVPSEGAAETLLDDSIRDRLVLSGEAAKILRISKSQLHKLVRRGQVPAWKKLGIGRYLLFDPVILRQLDRLVKYVPEEADAKREVDVSDALKTI